MGPTLFATLIEFLRHMIEINNFEEKKHTSKYIKFLSMQRGPKVVKSAKQNAKVHNKNILG